MTRYTSFTRVYSTMYSHGFQVLAPSGHWSASNQSNSDSAQLNSLKSTELSVFVPRETARAKCCLSKIERKSRDEDNPSAPPAARNTLGARSATILTGVHTHLVCPEDIQSVLRQIWLDILDVSQIE